MAAMTYDRREQDLGNILLLEHVNVRVPDQQAATLFYIAGQIKSDRILPQLLAPPPRQPITSAGVCCRA